MRKPEINDNFVPMLFVQSFCFNPFEENTYILYNEAKECAIIDPGMYNSSEESALSAFISENQLKPLLLLNTHCHIDHILGNLYCVEKYKIPFYCHENELTVLDMGKATAAMYGLRYTESPRPDGLLTENQEIKLGSESLKALFTPGHSPGSLSFYSEADAFVIAGDALFYQSIGRTDLPGGSHPTLIRSIRTQLLTLPEETEVYSGHGPSSTIGHEKAHNPFLV